MYLTGPVVTETMSVTSRGEFGDVSAAGEPFSDQCSGPSWAAEGDAFPGDLIAAGDSSNRMWWRSGVLAYHDSDPRPITATSIAIYVSGHRKTGRATSRRRLLEDRVGMDGERRDVALK